MPSIPQRVEDRADRLFGRLPLVEEEQVDVGVQAKLGTAVSTDGHHAQFGVGLGQPSYDAIDFI
jgi:hypothetical protein